MLGVLARAASAASLLLVVAVAPIGVVQADFDDVELNGRFTAMSDGQWAKTNERYHDEATVTSTWTITTTCRSYLDCSGQVSSDAGWTADVGYTEPLWYVVRHLDGWMTCPDGTAVAGTQTYKFFVDQFDEPRLRGWDTTLGPSGACGVNKVLNIEMPFRLTPLG